jgi:CRP/FNR family transcriptional regulator, cyclic AMP receptor protein
MSTRRKLPLLDVDPDLGALVPEDRREAARRELEVEVHRLPRGPWGAGGDDANPQHVGLLLIDGVIAREVVVSDTVSTELLGPGDIVRPWSVQATPVLLQLVIRWDALTETRVAILDRRFGAQLARWPEVNAALIDRVNDRAMRLAITQAISQLNRVDRRLLSLFWHLAERWGRMTKDGVAVPLTLSHRMLGQLVGARRPTVSTAIADLAERGELVRRSDGTWLLTGDPVGVPTEEAERLIPIRRKLFGRLDDFAEVPAAPARQDHEPLYTGQTELGETLERLRSESQLRIDELAALAGESRRLQAETLAARERREREREARAHR